MSNVNEDTYGAIADKYAAQYNIDPTIFRNLIRSESSFDPYAINTKAVNGEHASGIAQFLPSTAAEKGVNVFDPNSSLEGAAKYLSDLVKQYGNINAAVAKYKGYSDMQVGMIAAAQVTNTSPPVDNQAIKGNTGKGNLDWSSPLNFFSNIAQAVSSGFWGIIVGFIGLLIIVLTVWSIFKQSEKG